MHTTSRGRRPVLRIVGHRRVLNCLLLLLVALGSARHAGAAPTQRNLLRMRMRMKSQKARSPSRRPTRFPTDAPTPTICDSADNTTLWFRGHLYGLVSHKMSWTDANNYAQTLRCCNRTGHLVTITSAEENGAVQERFVTDTAWIGLTGSPLAGTLAWVTGENFTYDKTIDMDQDGTCYALFGDHNMDGVAPLSWLNSVCNTNTRSYYISITVSVVEFDCDSIDMK